MYSEAIQLGRSNWLVLEHEEKTDEPTFPCSAKFLFITAFCYFVLLFFMVFNTNHTRAVITLNTDHDSNMSIKEILMEELPKLNNSSIPEKHARKSSMNWMLKAIADEDTGTDIQMGSLTPIIENVAYIIEMEPKQDAQADNDTVFPHVNMANILIGASVDNELSSSNSLNTFFWGTQTGYVILDRPNPPKFAAWCSDEKIPVLTINLVKYSKPTHVSYQHTDWEGKVPAEAPRMYDVMACLDSDCTQKEYIALNCKYLPSQNQSGIEQKCPVHLSSPINKVQFHFRSTQGKSTKTCVSLIRVYADDKNGIARDETACKPIASYYYSGGAHQRRIAGHSSNCVFIYKLNCCSVCPHCCLACKMEENLIDEILNLSAFLVALAVIGAIIFATWFLLRKHYRKDTIGNVQNV